MHFDDDRLALSPTDLSNHLACAHLTALNLAAARGELERPHFDDPRLERLFERGDEHEREYLDLLRRRGVDVVELAGAPTGDEGFAATLEAMRSGAEAIAQATLVHGRWRGRADLLRRVELPGDLGAWSYEAHDTKLARETRGGTILQLALYSALLAEIQGREPEWMRVVTPGSLAEPKSYRVAEYAAYARRVRRRLEQAVDPGLPPPATYPDPVPHCDVCLWWSRCLRRRRDDDHLSLVAGMGRLQQRELEERGVSTLAGLAEAGEELAERPRRGSPATYLRLREQARAQLESRRRGEPFHELRPIAEGQGLARLPEPSPGDLFLDFEGDPFFGEGGLEYLTGWATLDGPDGGEPAYRGLWAMDRGGERAAFEALIDALMGRWAAYPGFHVYHFGHYEPATVKRLMGRHAAREDEVDRLLRGRRFVDLHAVVRQALVAGVESYSLKALEALHGPATGFARGTGLRDASRALQAVEIALERGRPDLVGGELRAAVEAYNRDDCLSTLHLRDWTEELRRRVVEAGSDIPRPALPDPEPPEGLDDRRRRWTQLAERVLDGVPPDAAQRGREEEARWLLVHALDFYRREAKVGWWEFFRLAELSDEERAEEKRAIGGLELVERLPPPTRRARKPVHVYRFPHQEVDDRQREAWVDAERMLGEVTLLDPEEGRIAISKRLDAVDLHPGSLFLHDQVRTGPLEEALFRLGEWVAENGIDAPGGYRAARDLLLRQPPRGCPPEGGSLRRPGEELVAAARRLVAGLDRGVLPLQGPPGTGKTYVGARMIVELVRRGERVGVAANSHAVIRQLLEKAVAAAREEGVELRAVHKITRAEEPTGDPALELTRSNGAVAKALAGGEVEVAGGTAWLWARDEMHEAVDVLVVDEAGQLSLTHTLAAAQAARSLVLVGDPQQLEQPIQASHPEGTDVAALDHLLGHRLTLPADRGLFLDRTWRLHPAICAFTSEQFYEGRLAPREELERQAVDAPGALSGSGLRFVRVQHLGNQGRSPEEAERVAELVDRLLAGSWTDAAGETRPIAVDDVLVVAPYNAQVAELRDRLPAGLRVGTVDKFQGQQAPVAIYSMTTSSPEDAPRGMEFLYSLHRLNVATSRARALAVVVASPALLEPECRTPRQMRLANALCDFVERCA